MKRSVLEQYLGKTVTITLFDNEVITGELHRTGEEKFKNNPNVGVVRAAKKLFDYEETGRSPYEVIQLMEREKNLTEKVKKMRDW